MSIVSGLVSSLVFYFLESRGLLVVIEPEAVAATGLNYIIWRFLISLLGFVLGKFIRIENKI